MMFSDLTRYTARALKNIIATSVTMNGGIFRRATAVPLSTPMRPPTITIRVIATTTAYGFPPSKPPCSERAKPQRGLFVKSTGSTCEVITTAPTTLTSAIIEVCERSMPPTIKTKV